MWTLDELVDRVGAALAEAEYPGAPNGRVRDVPDRRAVRWYATTGLVDRPAAMRGRVALYGPRHLLQLVAVKRRQAEGRSLAEIQAELAGATDTTLATIARVPEDLLAMGDRPAEAGPTRPRFWAAAPIDPAAAASGPSVAAPAPSAAAAPGPSAAASAPSVAAAPVRSARPGGFAGGRIHLPGHWADLSGEQADADTAATLAGVPLGDGAVLLLPAHPAAPDIAAIRAAARPLLDLLADRGLLTSGDPLPDRGPTAQPGPVVERRPVADLTRRGRRRGADPFTEPEPDARNDRGPHTQRSSS